MKCLWWPYSDCALAFLRLRVRSPPWTAASSCWRKTSSGLRSDSTLPPPSWLRPPRRPTSLSGQYQANQTNSLTNSLIVPTTFWSALPTLVQMSSAYLPPCRLSRRHRRDFDPTPDPCPASTFCPKLMGSGWGLALQPGRGGGGGRVGEGGSAALRTNIRIIASINCHSLAITWKLYEKKVHLKKGKSTISGKKKEEPGG